MRILGIDPGTATTGFGVIDTDLKGKFQLVKFGWITTQKDTDSDLRLKSIYRQMNLLIREQAPKAMAIERLFFCRNAKTAMKVSEAIGVIRLAAVNKRLKIFGYAPLKIKSVVTGNGWAKKDEMEKVVKKLLRFRTPKKKKTHFNDAADALGVAICHARIILNQKGGEKK